jgi:hypothetical protein
MRSKTVAKAWVVAALATVGMLASRGAWAQTGGVEGSAPPANLDLPFPLYNTHPENGGLFISSTCIYYDPKTLRPAESLPAAGPEARPGNVLLSVVVSPDKLSGLRTAEGDRAAVTAAGVAAAGVQRPGERLGARRWLWPVAGSLTVTGLALVGRWWRSTGRRRASASNHQGGHSPMPREPTGRSGPTGVPGGPR